METQLMQYINHWPDMAKLNIPKAVSQDLLHQLLQPFDSVGEAKDFWEEAPSTIIILDPTETIAQLKDSDTWNQLEFALRGKGVCEGKNGERGQADFTMLN